MAYNPSNYIDGEVDFGAPGEDGTAQATLPWGQAAPLGVVNYLVLVGLAPTADHTAEDAWIEGLTGYIADVVPGVSITVGVRAPEGTWGRYAVRVVQSF